MAVVAVVGSGPSGLYLADALSKADTALRVDVFDRLPGPFGLLRYGVAPDHGSVTLPSRKSSPRSEEHTSELQSLMRISYSVFCLTKNIHHYIVQTSHPQLRNQ